MEDSPISNHDTYTREAETPETLGKLAHQETFRNSRREGRPRAHQNMKRRNTQRMNTTQRQLIWDFPPEPIIPCWGDRQRQCRTSKSRVSPYGTHDLPEGADVQASVKPLPALRVCESRVARRRRHTAQPQRHWSVISVPSLGVGLDSTDLTRQSERGRRCWVCNF